MRARTSWETFPTVLMTASCLINSLKTILCHKQLDGKTNIHDIIWEIRLLRNAICGFSSLDELTNLPDLWMSNTRVWRATDWVTVILRNVALASFNVHSKDGLAECWLTATNRLTHTTGQNMTRGKAILFFWTRTLTHTEAWGCVGRRWQRWASAYTKWPCWRGGEGKALKCSNNGDYFIL